MSMDIDLLMGNLVRRIDNMNNLLKRIDMIIASIFLSMLSYISNCWGVVMIYLLVRIIFDLEEIKNENNK